MRLEALLILCLLIVVSHNHSDPKIRPQHKCQHDKRENHTLYKKMDTIDERNRLLQEDNVGEPIRITFLPHNWDRSITSNPVYMDYLSQLLSIVESFFEKKINVTRVEGQLKFEYDEVVVLGQTNHNFTARRSINNGVYLNPVLYGNQAKSESGTECLWVDVPIEHMNEGIADTDLLVYVTAFPDKDSYISFSGACLVTPRPTFGQLHVNTYYIFDEQFDSSDNMTFEYNVEIFVHEMFHILGFSNELYPYFLKPNGDFYSATQMFNLLDGQIYMTLPSLRDYAQEYYGCDTMLGMILEDDDLLVDVNALQEDDVSLEDLLSTSSKPDQFSSSHWKRQVLADEVMTETYQGNLQVSRFTLAVLKETNWYKAINTTSYDLMYFGKGRGCSFVNKQCHGDKFREYCGVWTPQELIFPKYTGRIGCTYDSGAVGVCYPALAVGNDCLDMMSFTNYYCYDERNQNNYEATEPNITLETFGLESRCFVSSFRLENYSFRGDIQHRCYTSSCTQDDNGQYSVLVQTGKFSVICTIDGQVLNAPKGISGRLQCPPNIREFCQNYNKKCKNFCSQNGFCFDEECVCKEGFTGTDCSQCAFFMFEGQCIKECPRGTYQVDTMCLKCAPECSECNQDGCIQCQENYLWTQINQLFRDYIPMIDVIEQPDVMKPQVMPIYRQPLYNCTTNCGNGTYQNEQYCYQCLQNCSICGTSTNCKYCNQGMFLYSILDQGVVQCLPECPNGTYIDNSEGQARCVNCVINYCSTCNQEGYCKRCLEDYYLQQDGLVPSCLKQCDLGFEADVETQQCIRCSENCIDCMSGNCHKCNDDTYLFNSICVSSCPDGYFKKDRYCKPCSSGCAYCKALDYCGACQKGFDLSNGYCLNQCADGEYPEVTPDGISCTKCKSECKTCTDVNGCRECADQDYVLTQEKQCLQSCPPGQYSDSNNDCQQCKRLCMSCKDEESCFACMQPFLLQLDGSCSIDCIGTGVEGVCVQCQVKNCIKCQPDPNECEQCQEGRYYDPNTQDCLHYDVTIIDPVPDPVGPTPLPPDESQIKPDESQDKPDESPTKPDEPPIIGQPSISSETTNPTVTKCEPGFFVSDDNKCEKCHYSCKECKGGGSSQCVSCTENNNRLFNDGKCSCQQEFNDTGDRVCQRLKCFYSCQTCFGEKFDDCLTCDISRELKTLTNECVCVSGQVDNGKPQCEEPPAFDSTISTTFQATQPATETLTTGASMFIVSSASTSFSFGQNMRLSDASQKVSYVGYSDTPLLGSLGDQIKVQQQSNQPAMLAMLFSSGDEDSTTNTTAVTRLLPESETTEQGSTSQTLKRYGKRGSFLKDFVPILVSWIIGVLVFGFVLLGKVFCCKPGVDDGISNNATSFQKLIYYVRKNYVMVYALLFLGTLQEELFIIFVEIKKMDLSTGGDIANLAFACIFLLFHVLGTATYLTYRLYKQINFADQIRRVYGLIPIKGQSEGKCLKLRRGIVRWFICVKMMDKLIVVLLTVFTYQSPDFLLYLFLVTILFALFINVPFIFESYLMMFLSTVTDIFTMVIIFAIYRVQKTSATLKGTSFDERGVIQVQLSTNISFAESSLTFFALYKLGVFIVELLYGLVRFSTQKKVQQQKSKENLIIQHQQNQQLELQKFFTPPDQRIPIATQINVNPPRQSVSRQTTLDNNQERQSISRQQQYQQQQLQVPDSNQFNSQSSQQSKTSAISYQFHGRENQNLASKPFDSTSSNYQADAYLNSQN